MSPHPRSQTIKRKKVSTQKTQEQATINRRDTQ